MPVRVTQDRTAEVLANLHELARFKLLVGVPEDKSSRSGATSRVTNALIAYVTENGSPAQNIPARPVIIPGIKAGREQGLKILKATGQKALEGKTGAIEQGFHAAGLVFQNAMRARVSSNIPPPLAASTIRNRRRRSKGSAYRRQATTASDVIALLDTGQYRASLTYVVKKQ